MNVNNNTAAHSILPPIDDLIETIRRIRTMSLDQAQSALKKLIAKVDAGDIEGGKAALSELKVRKEKRITLLDVALPSCNHFKHMFAPPSPLLSFRF